MGTKIIKLHPQEEGTTLVGKRITLTSDPQEYTVTEIVTSGVLIACVRLEPYFSQVEQARARGAVVTFGECAGLKHVYIGGGLAGAGASFVEAVRAAFPDAGVNVL